MTQVKLWQHPATSGPVATKIIVTANVCYAEIDNIAGVREVDWEIFGTNKSGILLPTMTIWSGGTKCDFTMPADVSDVAGRAYGIRVTVNGGLDQYGVKDPALVTTFGIYVASSQTNFCPLFCGEEFEFDSEVGWARLAPFLLSSVPGGDLRGTIGTAIVQGIDGKLIDYEATSEVKPGRSLAMFTDTTSSTSKFYQVGNVDYGAGEDGGLNIGNSDVLMTRDMRYSFVRWNASATGRLITNRFMLRSVEIDLRNAPVDAICPGTGQDAATTNPGNTPGSGGWLPPGQAGVSANTSAGAITAYHAGTGGRAATTGTSGNSRTTPSVANALLNLGRSPIPPTSGGIICAGAGASPTTGSASGAGASYLGIKCGVLITGALTPAGAISSRGGKGGLGLTTLSGGGGGGGGCIDLECEARFGPIIGNLLNCDGGDGGGITTTGSTGYTGEGGRGGIIRATCSMNNATTAATRNQNVNALSGSVTGGVNNSLVGGLGGQCRANF